MPEEQTPLSYQTTMPEYPDVSYEGYYNDQGYPSGLPRFMAWLEAAFSGKPDYKTWRTNKLDEYEALKSQYNTWLSTGAGIKASAKSGDYNPSYFDGGSASASPLNYQDVSPESSFTDMAQGVAGVVQMISALQNMKMTNAMIAGKQLQNQEQEIKNRYLDHTLRLKNTSLFNQGHLLGYRADDAAFRSASNLYSVFGIHKDIAANEQFSPFGIMSYNLKDFKDSPLYQKAWADIALVREAKAMRRDQRQLLQLSAKEKRFYIDNIQGIYHRILEGQLSIVNGQVNFQPIEQELRKKATNWGIALNATNTVLNAAKTIISLATGLPIAGGSSAIQGVPDWQNNQSNTSWLEQMYGSDYLPGF